MDIECISALSFYVSHSRKANFAKICGRKWKQCLVLMAISLNFGNSAFPLIQKFASEVDLVI